MNIEKNQNRRIFLKSSALATAGMEIKKSFAIGKPITPSQTVNIAVIGCGTRGTLHTKSFSHIPGVRLAAFCDVHKGRGNKLYDMAKNKYNDIEVEKKRKELLKYCKIDTLAMVKLHEELVKFI